MAVVPPRIQSFWQPWHRVTPSSAWASTIRSDIRGPKCWSGWEAAHVHTLRTDREGAETFLLSADGAVRNLPAGAAYK